MSFIQSLQHQHHGVSAYRRGRTWITLAFEYELRFISIEYQFHSYSFTACQTWHPV